MSDANSRTKDEPWHRFMGEITENILEVMETRHTVFEEYRI